MPPMHACVPMPLSDGGHVGWGSALNITSSEIGRGIQNGIDTRYLRHRGSRSAAAMFRSTPWRRDPEEFCGWSGIAVCRSPAESWWE